MMKNQKANDQTDAVRQEDRERQTLYETKLRFVNAVKKHSITVSYRLIGLTFCFLVQGANKTSKSESNN